MRISAQRRWADMPILTCTETSRHSISELILSLTFVLQRRFHTYLYRHAHPFILSLFRFPNPSTQLSFLLWRSVHVRVNCVLRQGFDCGPDCRGQKSTSKIRKKRRGRRWFERIIKEMNWKHYIERI